ncbi:hypothetical protein A3I18_02505 [Candidatus Campbellbacteria bacterium RIFCSPLOWO2_02_FULL_35_11]|uniref:Uncharacterized protein n=2 Tax=Candidatus Campbelliibacteriota TaxID=1752727 RepID=A0A1F5EKZ0_9BACT|nr:MAG: hypothetical protein A3E89_02750 [Candidatus Campbellbacteria bacterium RIFCSPHIGHO2_12_FULL_35_10]OGD70742.1 MAG: hypothetical protein A3I18_02505 [Candidatus Campbellbacteria bacterium RIFCSPLOWO2_02_FULL_35_11]
MIKKILIFIIVVLVIWLSALYFNKNNQQEEIIIGGDTNNTIEDVNDPIVNLAKAHCELENTAEVYVSSTTIKVVGKLLGAGATYTTADGSSSFSCPVVAPDSMTTGCKNILTIPEIEWKKVCSNE